jgi:EAL domain-containing protein (putative c-di-GMP-specific phosphodiesterase class I)
VSGPDRTAEAEKLAGAPMLAEVLPGVVDGFAPAGVLGALVIDTRPLQEIEQGYGWDAYVHGMRGIVEAARSAAFEALGDGATVAAGEVGRSEVFVFVTREEGSSQLLSRDMPALARMVIQRLERQGAKILYPYRRSLPHFSLGYSLVMRNPRLGALTQIRQVLEQARADARLNWGVYQRDRRRGFMNVLLGNKVCSVYEPVVDAKTLTVFGYEALARGPEHTEFAGAAALFGAAAEHDLLYELDCACRMAALEGAIDFPQGAKLFMNIRPTAIHDPHFQPDVLVRTLERCKLSPRDVVFEISEQESIENYQIFREARDAYGQLGFQFALDDTGAGYASLEAVMELSPEFIKVDRSFVRGLDEDEGRQAMLRAFQEVADSVNARIIGEGLDRLEELQTLAELGISFGQGWVFGKPTPLRANPGRTTFE